MTAADRGPITLAESDLLNAEIRKALFDLLARSSPERIAAPISMAQGSLAPFTCLSEYRSVCLLPLGEGC